MQLESLAASHRATDGPSTLGRIERDLRPSPLALAVLGLLAAAPLHPYGIQRLLKDWGKDKVVNVGNRATLYKTITRLRDAGLVRVQGTEKDQLYPERTVYELTDLGRAQSMAWLTDMLSVPRREFNDFPAALSFAIMLGPELLQSVLAQRAGALEAQVAQLEAELASTGPQLPRITLIEEEYLLAITVAEIGWLRAIIDDLAEGSLVWDEELLKMAQAAIERTLGRDAG